MEKSFEHVQNPVDSDPAKNSAVDRYIERLETLLEESNNDRDRFARKYHEQKALAEYWRRECEKRKQLVG